MKLAIMGTGYVGIVTGTGLANLGNDVICVDIDIEKIDKLSDGGLTIYEPGLEEIFQRNIKSGRLNFSTDTVAAVQKSDVIFICVGTPCNHLEEADLEGVRQVAEAVGRHMNGYKVVVDKSTVPVGTADLVRDIIRRAQTEKIPFDVVSNPEFLREGVAVKDFENPDRIIIGTDSDRACRVMTALYRSVARTDRPIMITDIRSAEIIKYAGNAMLATRISFMNQLAHLCEKAGADIKAVSRGLGLDSRIGPRFLQAGVGYGGSCFPKDIRALIATLKQHGCRAELFEAVHRINERQKLVAVEKLQTVLDLKNAKVALWGLAFKPKTDDIREAPALTIIAELKRLGTAVHAFDPIAIPNAAKVLEDVRFFDDPYETVRDCDALILVTEWDVFRNLEMQIVRELLRKPILIDGRNIYDPEEMKKLGFTYLGVGR